MLTLQEQGFVDHWSVERLKKKNWLRKYTIGWPLGVLIVAMIFVNLLSGWHKQANKVLRENSSVILVIMLAALCIVAFITWFSYNYQWEQKEEQYQHLLKKNQQTAQREGENGGHSSEPACR